MTRPLRLYLAMVIALGGAALAASAAAVAAGPHRYEWALFAALGIATGAFNMNLGSTDSSISVADTFFITCALLYGPAAAAVAIAADSLVLSFIRRRHGLVRGLFNTLGATLAMFIGASAFFRLAGVGPLASSHANVLSLILPLMALAIVYFAINCGTVAGAIAIESGKPLAGIWRDHFRWLATGYFAAASLAFCLVLVIQQSNALAAVVVLPLLVIFHLTLRATFGRVDDARRHMHAMDRLYLSTIETLAMAIDAKDDVTHSHVRRVQTLALAMARAMGLTDQAQLKAIEAAALLHDTGKLAVPEHILNKPGGLTDAEFDKMKLHADIGADILSLVGFPFPVVPIVRCHHENWDGSGYPNGVAGTQIPIGARILSVVDCFDALTSDRPYRRRLTDADAFQVLRERSGRMYDPQIVETFIRIHPDIVLAEDDPPAHRDVMQRIARARQTPQASAPTAATSAVAEHAQDEMFAFVGLARLVSGDATRADVLALASHLLANMIPGVSGAWFLPDAAHDRLVAGHAFGPGAGVLRGMALEPGERLSGWVAASRQVIVNSPAALDLGERAGLVEPALRRSLSVPVTTGATLVAVLTLYSPDERAFDDQRARVVQIVVPHIAQALIACGEDTPDRQESLAVERLRSGVSSHGALGRPH
jgi:putative nucleotidyltransferase with HDIG domain